MVRTCTWFAAIETVHEMGTESMFYFSPDGMRLIVIGQWVEVYSIALIGRRLKKKCHCWLLELRTCFNVSVLDYRV